MAWHAWPAAIVVAVIAIVCARMTMDPAGQGFEQMINAMQNLDDVPNVARTAGAPAALHVAVNLGVLGLLRGDRVAGSEGIVNGTPMKT